MSSPTVTAVLTIQWNGMATDAESYCITIPAEADSEEATDKAFRPILRATAESKALDLEAFDKVETLGELLDWMDFELNVYGYEFFLTFPRNITPE